jgi:3-hydroxy-3-methylglutaryl CoA synthase/uncharacterized OB-fold protein
MEGHGGGSGARGVTAYGAYVPAPRLRRQAAYAANQWANPGLKALARGERAFASWDEDVVTMAVEAARDAGCGRLAERLDAALLCSTTAPFADRSNAGLVAAALGLPERLLTLDVSGSQRAGTGGIIAGAALAGHGSVLVAAAERRRAKPGSPQEFSGGDAAAAVVLGRDDVLARIVATESIACDFVDHWRGAAQPHDYTWEERWVREEGYLKIVPRAVQAVLGRAGMDPARVDHFILPSPLRDADQAVARSLRLRDGVVRDSLASRCGCAGAAHGLLMLAHALEEAKPGETILMTSFGNGCDAVLFEVTDAITGFRPARGASGWLAAGRATDDYLKFLSFGGEVEIDWGPRAESGNKYAPTAEHRHGRDMLAFVGGRDVATGVVQFPKTPVSVAPGAAGAARYEDVRLADEPARIVSSTADWLTYHPSPPFNFGLVQFDNGARVLMEFVDVEPGGAPVGAKAAMAFRIKEIDRMRDYRRYVWKARPLPETAATDGAGAGA